MQPSQPQTTAGQQGPRYVDQVIKPPTVQRTTKTDDKAGITKSVKPAKSPKTKKVQGINLAIIIAIIVLVILIGLSYYAYKKGAN